MVSHCVYLRNAFCFYFIYFLAKYVAKGIGHFCVTSGWNASHIFGLLRCLRAILNSAILFISIVVYNNWTKRKISWFFTFRNLSESLIEFELVLIFLFASGENFRVVSSLVIILFKPVLVFFSVLFCLDSAFISYFFSWWTTIKLLIGNFEGLLMQQSV